VAPAIQAVGLEREFKGGVKAVAGIDIEVAAGEVYGFLGPNGAGKTTTVRMLVTLLRPTGGSARVAGFDVAKQPADVRRQIGVALQEAALDQLMTGRELIELQATLHGIAPRRVAARGQELIERVGLLDAQDRRVATYSGGMRRRLDLAMALIHSPSVLFLDQLADRLGIISGGLLVAEGTPSALKAEVGSPHLDVSLASRDSLEPARAALARFGTLRPTKDPCRVSVAVPDGAEAIAPVVRALDEAGVLIASLEVVEPTLDDVFLAKTGERLEDDTPAA